MSGISESRVAKSLLSPTFGVHLATMCVGRLGETSDDSLPTSSDAGRFLSEKRLLKAPPARHGVLRRGGRFGRGRRGQDEL
jgi:hypothetical protein